MISAIITFGQVKHTFTPREILDFLWVMGYEPAEYAAEVLRQLVEGCLMWADEERTLFQVRGMS
jgi:hypothetical protein